MNYLSSMEAAKAMGITVRRVQQMCKQGEISGAVKKGHSWLIPENAVWPDSGEKKKPMPIGISDFKTATTSYYYVDKTLLIRDFLDAKPMVSLFTRPRRFGKTLNMDMVRVFFEKTQDDTSIYFKDKQIWQCGSDYTRHQGKYPVIFLTFKDVKCLTWQETFQKLRKLISLEFIRHSELEESTALGIYEKEQYHRLASDNANEVDCQMGLQILSLLLHKHYGQECIIIIDEYDTPIQEGYSKDFYNEIIDFMRVFFSGAFKDNRNLSYGFLTGILRIAQESIFSGLNNLSVNSIMDEDYSQFFGFTSSEVYEMLQYYGMTDKMEELKEWYDGYLFGNEEIYNPWSVINYVSKKGIPQAYWVNTGKNEILVDVLQAATEEIKGQLYDLLQGKSVITRIDQNVVYRALAEDPDNIFSLLLVAGYLKTPKKELQPDGSYLCEVSIPNKEIAAVYKSEILFHLMQIGAITRTTANKIAESLFACNYTKLQKAIAEYLDKSVSFYDGGTEGFYHGLVLGLIALMDNQYRIKSNRESGDGRYDITMFPREKKHPGIIMEFKWKADLKEEEMEQFAADALRQIDEKRYDAELIELGVTPIFKLGIAFSGKRVKVKTI